ncbi:MAG TPA: slipin family protein [Euzebyales bacterium]|nr:slipin family protein [Euzebyales bacterium]
MSTWTFLLLFVLVVAAVILVNGMKIIPEYERGVIFRLGRVVGARGPGLFFVIPLVEQMTRVNMQVITEDIEPQDIITRDNVTVQVNAVAYYRVVEPVKAIVDVQDYRFATSQIAQTTLRSIIGQADLDELLINRDEINSRLQSVIDEETNPWGVKVTSVEVKDVELDPNMRRAMARQAEAERERRAKVINAQGEKEAALTLSEAARDLEAHPAAMQLRLLSTMSEIASEQNSTLVLPIPVELLRFLDAGRGLPGPAR